MSALYYDDFTGSNNAYYIGVTYSQTYFTCDVDFDDLDFDNLCYFVKPCTIIIYKDYV